MLYNHAYTIAFEVFSTDEDGATLEEWWQGLRLRMQWLEQDEDERRSAWETDIPYDTDETTQEDMKQWLKDRNLDDHSRVEHGPDDPDYQGDPEFHKRMD